MSLRIPLILLIMPILLLDRGQEEKGATEDEMAGWHRQLDGHEFEHAPGDGDGQGSLACCGPWGRKESDTTKQLNYDNNAYLFQLWYMGYICDPAKEHQKCL